MRITDTYRRLEERELYMGQDEILVSEDGAMDASEKDRILKRTIGIIRAEKNGGIQGESRKEPESRGKRQGGSW